MKKSKTKDKYNLTLTKKQLEIINKALEFYSRISMGQFQELLWPEQYDFKWNFNCRTQENKDKLESLKMDLINMPYNSYYGIASPQLPESPKIVYDIYQVIRHNLSWEEYPEGGHTVNFNIPLKTSNEELPKLKKCKN